MVSARLRAIFEILQDSLRNLGCDRFSEVSSELYRSPVADDWITGSDSCINKSVSFRNGGVHRDRI